MWYYADATFDYSNVQNGKDLSNCLVSDSNFTNCSSHETNNSKVYDASADYPQNIIKKYFKKYKKQNLINEYKKNQKLRFPFLSSIIEKLKKGEITNKIKDFFDR